MRHALDCGMCCGLQVCDCGAEGPRRVFALDFERATFEQWAKDHLGQGYSLTREDGNYLDPVTRWAFVAWKAGKKAKTKAIAATMANACAAQRMDSEAIAANLMRFIGIDKHSAREMAANITNGAVYE